jgi:hypothetical protein
MQSGHSWKTPNLFAYRDVQHGEELIAAIVDLIREQVKIA